VGLKLNIKIDWKVRKQEKWRIFSKFVSLLLAIIIGSVVCIIAPLWVVNKVLGEAFLISIPPMLLMSLSWMAGTWKFFDDRRFLIIVTVGMMPIRIILVLAFTLMLVRYSDVVILAFVIGMVIHWVLFAVPEMMMMYQFSKLKSTKEEEPL